MAAVDNPLTEQDIAEIIAEVHRDLATDAAWRSTFSALELESMDEDVVSMDEDIDQHNNKILVEDSSTVSSEDSEYLAMDDDSGGDDEPIVYTTNANPTLVLHKVTFILEGKKLEKIPLRYEQDYLEVLPTLDDGIPNQLEFNHYTRRNPSLFYDPFVAAVQSVPMATSDTQIALIDKRKHEKWPRLSNAFHQRGYEVQAVLNPVHRTVYL